MAGGTTDTKKKKMVVWGVGSGFILVGILILGLAGWEFVTGISKSMSLIDAPGFHELDLGARGVYNAVYQHTGDDPIPAQELASLDVRVHSRESFEDIAVTKFPSGMVQKQMGTSVVPVFQFIAPIPGLYTLSAIYPTGEGPRVQLLIYSGAARGVRNTLIVGGIFFLLFVGLGIFLFIRGPKWLGLQN